MSKQKISILVLINLFFFSSTHAQEATAPALLPTETAPMPPPSALPKATPDKNPQTTNSESSATNAPSASDKEETSYTSASESKTLLDTTTSKAEAYKSIMFQEEEINEINNVIDAIKNNEPLNTGEAGTPAPSEITYTYPQFYLASIVYYAANDWVIWFNNQKITSNDKEIIKNLSIISVEPSQIVFSYIFDPTDRNDFHKKAEDERITLDVYNRKATVLLHPNQTFSSYNWKIYEGKVQEVVEQGKKKKQLLDNLPQVEEVFSNALSEEGVAEDTDNKSGIQGLLNQYKNLDKTTP